MEILAEKKLKEVLQLIEKGEPLEAQKLIDELLVQYIDCNELIYTNRCCIFLEDSIHRIESRKDKYVQSELIFQEWKAFQDFISRESIEYEPALLSVQHGFFFNALKKLEPLLDEKDLTQRAEYLKKIGMCFKKLGNFERARTYLSEANNICPNVASVLAELADCYSLCGEDKFGKVLFREAFFLNPESIDIDFLDSQLIKCLIDITKQKGHTGKLINLWIPIYGVLYGVFNIRRQLNSQEVIKLKKDIYAIENESKDPSCNEKVLTPQLLNKYFWLIDYYVQTHESNSKIKDVLLKIRLLDNSVYENYIK